MSCTVLIIEDEAEIADTLRYAVESEGMQSLWESQGRKGMATLDQHAVDLVILDVGLPDCSGFELLKEIRVHSDIPVMMLTARSDEVDRVVGLEIGADDYVTKPFSPREVVARVKAILKRSQNGSTVRVNGFDLNPAARKVLYQGKSLQLTRSEYILLTTLMAHPGQIFSRRQLIEHIWSDQHPSDDRIIDTYVKAIRAKLQVVDDSSMPLVTHRGFGYALEV